MKKNVRSLVGIALLTLVVAGSAFAETSTGYICKGNVEGGTLEVRLGGVHARTFEAGLGYGRGSQVITREVLDVLSFSYSDKAGNSPWNAKNMYAVPVRVGSNEYRIATMGDDIKLVMPKTKAFKPPFHIRFNGDDVLCNQVIENVERVE